MDADRPFIESSDASNLLRSLQDLIRPAILVSLIMAELCLQYKK